MKKHHKYKQQQGEGEVGSHQFSSKWRNDYNTQIRCCSSSSSSSDSNSNSDSKTGGGRGFGTRPRSQKSPPTLPSQAPSLGSRKDGQSNNVAFDLQFEQRLQAVRRSALDQKKAEEEKEFGAIDYDAPVNSESSTIGLGTKIGVGVAVVVFGLVFALGDFLLSDSTSPSKEATELENLIPQEEKAKLQARLQQYEATLNISPEDPTALEGAAVTLTELGEYTRAASLLDRLTKKKPSDPEVFRLLGEVKYELKDYEGSAAAYRSSAMVSQNMDFEVLRGLTNALLGAKKPEEAVQVILAARESLIKDSVMETKLQVDPIQVELLLGKAYSDWGHVSDAVSVYDQLISNHPDDFRGYLAKGIILKENGKLGDAERMFIQARFFAPEGGKALVDRYSRQ